MEGTMGEIQEHGSKECGKKRQILEEANRERKYRGGKKVHKRENKCRNVNDIAKKMGITLSTRMLKCKRKGKCKNM